ncbi:MAG: hypothetical protein AVO33_02610 [delta proteobacterium ML8_F1]|nr:MAG: hypothetical protein AVO33_02610 [delta proteobacterium ML8_F1]
MIEAIKKIDSSEALKIRLIQSPKFKTNLTGLFLLRPLTEKEASMLALVSRLMKRGTKNHPGSKAFNDRLEELYGAVFSADVTKYGERLGLQVKIQVPNPRYVAHKEIFKEAIDFLREAVFELATDGSGFISEAFEQERENLIQEIHSRVNDKMTYAVDRCIEFMCHDEPFSVYQYGSVAMLQSLTNPEVYEYYRQILKSSAMTLIAIGDFDFPETTQIIREVFRETTDPGRVSPERNPEEKTVENVRTVKETLKVNQGKLTLGYRTGIRYDHPLYEASVLFSTILGGGGSSKLFQNIREKESLCYYIFSKVEKFKSLMIISSGIDTLDYQRTLDLVLEEVEKMKRGEFTEEDLETAKEIIVSSIESLSDYPNSFLNYYFSRELTGRAYDEKEIIAEVMAVTKEEVMAAGGHYQLDTIHFIEGGQNHED